MKKLIVATFASSLLFTASFAGAQTARARIADTPIRAEANLASAIIATLSEGGSVDVIDIQGEWYRVLVPNEQSKPRVGYVLANLIDILSASGSPLSISTPTTHRPELPLAQGQRIPPTVADLGRERNKAKERAQAGTELAVAKAELAAARADLNALQTDPLFVPGRESAQPMPRRDANARVPSPAADEVADLSLSARSFKSASAKFFVGADFEGTGYATSSDSSTMFSGPGLGLVIGYGFTPIWAVYGNLSGASVSDVDGDSFGLGHFDVGVRAHFLSGPHVVVPFVQAGVSGRGVTQTVITRFGQHEETASGAGLGVGGGLNVHVRPALAISAGITLSFGNFTNFTQDKQTVQGDSWSATSARVHVGIMWFPQTHASKG